MCTLPSVMSASLATSGIGMVVGHTIQEFPPGKIHTRCDGQIVLTDTGFSQAFET